MKDEQQPFFTPSITSKITLRCIYGNAGMKGNYNFEAGLIWWHERCQMKSLSKPGLILFIAFRSLRKKKKICSLWRLWFDSPVVLDLVPPWYLWHVDIKWFFRRRAAPIFQSPLSAGYVALVWTKRKPVTCHTKAPSQAQRKANNCNYISWWAAAIFGGVRDGKYSPRSDPSVCRRVKDWLFTGVLVKCPEDFVFQHFDFEYMHRNFIQHRENIQILCVFD